MDFALAGLRPWMFHLTNLLLHIGSVLLFFAIAKRLTNQAAAAFIAAALFAIHPLHTETVVWATARKDLLSCFFLLGSVLLWLRWNDDHRTRWYAGSFALFMCALLSKVSALLAPLFLIFLIGDKNRFSWRRWKVIAPFLGVSMVFAIIASFGKETVGHFYLEQILMGCHALIFLLWKLILPVNLSVLYPFTHDIGFTEPRIALSVLGVLAITGGCLWTARKNHWPLLAWIWFVLMMAPSFGNFAKGHNELLDAYVTSDRYAYAASLSLFLLIGIWVGRLRQRYAFVDAIVIIMFIVLIGLSVRQTLTWKDSESLWRHVIAVQPNSYLAHSNLGVLLAKRGDREGAALEFGTALGIRPDAQTYRNLGVLLEEVGKPDLALRAYQKAVESSPLQKDAYVRIAVLLSKQGKFEDALKAFQEAKELDPSDVEIDKAIEWLNTGKALP